MFSFDSKTLLFTYGQVVVIFLARLKRHCFGFQPRDGAVSFSSRKNHNCCQLFEMTTQENIFVIPEWRWSSWLTPLSRRSHGDRPTLLKKKCPQIGGRTHTNMLGSPLHGGPRRPHGGLTFHPTAVSAIGGQVTSP